MEVINEEVINEIIYIQTQIENIIKHIENLESGLQILIYISVAFLVWKVIQIIYKLLAGVFLGGI